MAIFSQMPVVQAGLVTRHSHFREASSAVSVGGFQFK